MLDKNTEAFESVNLFNLLGTVGTISSCRSGVVDAYSAVVVGVDVFATSRLLKSILLQKVYTSE
jgi:hypothetical protein